MFKWLNSKKKDNKGFTLVELVIVVAILAILVGLLAPQYTKYVEKSRKAADASNMDEMVKVIKVYAADPVNDLETGDYVITIGASGGTNITGKLSISDGDYGTGKNPTGLAKELEASIPSWYNTVTKSQKWGQGGKPAAITATVTVGTDGGTKVTYGSILSNGNTKETSSKFATYMETGSEQ